MRAVCYFLVVLSMLSNCLNAQIFDRSTTQNNYHCLVSVNKDSYDQSLPGKYAKENYSKDKWYFDVFFFDKDKFVKKFSFPAALQVKAEELENFKPVLVGFVERDKGQHGYWRYMLTIENDGLFKYNLLNEKNISTGRMWTSVDFGKRIPLYVSGGKKSKVDKAFIPYSVTGAQADNVYFKTVDGKTHVWNSTTEKVSDDLSPPQRPAAQVVSAQEQNGTISVTSSDLKLTLDSTKIDPNNIEKIDPLSVKTERRSDAFAGYGTNSSPIPMLDVEHLVKFYQLPYGKIMQAAKQTPAVFQAGVADGMKSEFRSIVKDMAATMVNKSEMLRELKLVMREFGVTSILKKTRANDIVEKIIWALSPEQGGGGVMQFRDRKKDSRETVIMVAGRPVITWDYYRHLKRVVKNNEFEAVKTKALWNDVSSDNKENLTRALWEYSKKAMKPAVLKDVLTEFMKVKDQRNWVKWFEDSGSLFNKNLYIELMFDYLKKLQIQNENKLDAILKSVGMKMVKVQQFKVGPLSAYQGTKYYIRDQMYKKDAVSSLLKK